MDHWCVRIMGHGVDLLPPVWKVNAVILLYTFVSILSSTLVPGDSLPAGMLLVMG